MRRILWASLATLLVLAGPALAADVIGTVVDADGFEVEAARVSLRAGDGECISVYTGADGAFTFADVAEGIYTLKAGKPGVGSATVEGVEVEGDEPIDVGVITLVSGPHGPHGGKGPNFQQD